MQNTDNTPTALNVTEQKCPQCQNIVPVYTGFVTWCDKCNWNVRAYEPEKPKNVFEGLYLKLGKKLSQQMFEELVKAQSLKPKWTLSKVLAYILAVMVHSITLAVAVGGLLLIFKSWPNIIGVLLGIFCLLLSTFLLPRRAKIPEKNQVSRQNFPALYGVVDKVAIALNTSSVDTILIDDQFNASISQIGFRRRKILSLGLPLLSILTPSEKIALLGHELGHCVNGDTNRSLVVGTAINTLNEWYRGLYPGSIWPRNNRRIGIINLLGTVVTNLITLALANVARFVMVILSQLLWRIKQRAEYLADALAAEVGSSKEMLGLLDKLHFRSTFDLTLQRFSLNAKNLNLFSELQKNLGQVPPRELERVKRSERLTNSRLDTTHPPTAYRIDFLMAHPVAEPKVVLSSAEVEALERELRSAQKSIQDKLVDLHLDRLYR